MQIFEIDKDSLPEEVTDFVAVECADCEYEGEGDFSQRYFRTEPEVECDKSHNQAIELLKPFGFTKYSAFAAKEVILGVSRCPKCGSEDIILDY